MVGRRRRLGPGGLTKTRAAIQPEAVATSPARSPSSIGFPATSLLGMVTFFSPASLTACLVSSPDLYEQQSRESAAATDLAGAAQCGSCEGGDPIEVIMLRRPAAADFDRQWAV